MDEGRRSRYAKSDNARRSEDVDKRYGEDHGGQDVPSRTQPRTQNNRRVEVHDVQHETISAMRESTSDHVRAKKKMQTEHQDISQQRQTLASDLSRYKKITACICSLVAIVVSLMYIALGIVAIVLRLYAESAVPFVGAVTCLVHGGFGIHFSRQKSCNRVTVVTVVVTICGIVLWAVFGTFAYWAGQFLGEPGKQYQYRRPDLGYISVAGACITIVALAGSMVQLWIACAVTCCAEAPRSKYNAARTVTDRDNYVL